MKRTIALLLVVTAATLSAGCGGSPGGPDALAMLMEASEAMAGTAGYRMRGDIEMGMGAGSVPMVVGVRADVQNAPDGMRQHMFVTMGEFEAEAYIVGDTYYQQTPGQGWRKMSLGLYKAQSMNMGMVDVDQVELMAKMAADTRILEEKDGRIGIAFRLGKEYFDFAMKTYREYLEGDGQEAPKEWLRTIEESITGFNADISVWINASSRLIERMEISYSMSGIPQVGELSSSMRVDLYDYEREIEIELPPEAAQAEEVQALP